MAAGSALNLEAYSGLEDLYVRAGPEVDRIGESVRKGHIMRRAEDSLESEGIE